MAETARVADVLYAIAAAIDDATYGGVGWLKYSIAPDGGLVVTRVDPLGVTCTPKGPDA